MKFSICIITVAVLALTTPSALARRFTKCEVAREMYSIGYSMDSLPDWMCLVESESAFNSSSVGGPNSNGSFDWGIFQINDNYWCEAEFEGLSNDCGIECTSE